MQISLCVDLLLKQVPAILYKLRGGGGEEKEAKKSNTAQTQPHPLKGGMLVFFFPCCCCPRLGGLSRFSLGRACNACLPFSLCVLVLLAHAAG